MGDAGRIARAVLASAGLDVAIGYGVFLFIALFVDLVPAGAFMGLKVTLADLLAGDAADTAPGRASGKGMFLVLLAAATVAVPYVWKHKAAPLAFCVPLLVTALAFWPLYRQQRAQQQAIEGLGELGLAVSGLAEQAGAPSGPLDAIGIGSWFLVATVMFLALKGIARALARR